MEYKYIETAFPFRENISDGLIVQHPGMELRDYFAAKALNGLFASGDIDFVKFAGMADKKKVQLCSAMYALADMMMEVRKK